MLLFGGSAAAMIASLKYNLGIRKPRKNIYGRGKKDPISEKGDLKIEPITIQARNAIRKKALETEKRNQRVNLISLIVISLVALAFLFYFVF